MVRKTSGEGTFGYIWDSPGKKLTYTNEHAGCRLIFNTNTYNEEEVKAVYCPPHEQRGRGGAVHIVQRGEKDIVFLVAYFPQSPDGCAKEHKPVDLMCKWVESIYERLGERTLIVSLTDANIRHGPQASGEVHIPDDIVGAYGIHAKGNYTGQKMVEMARRQHMSFIQTQKPQYAGGTYKSAEGNWSQPDQYLVPEGHREAVVQVKSLCEIGHQLQRAERATNLDHVPVELVMEYRHFFLQQEARQGWDHTTLRRALHDHQLRNLFLDSMTEWADQHSEEINEAKKGAHTDTNFRCDEWMGVLNHGMVQVGQRFFGKSRIHKQVWHTDEIEECNTKRKEIRKRNRQEAMIGRSIVLWWRESFGTDNVAGRKGLQALARMAFRAWRTGAVVSVEIGIQRKTLLKEYNKQYARLKRKSKRRYAAETAADMRRAYYHGDAAEVYRLSRTQSGKPLGPKKRRFDRVTTTRPTIADWDEFTSRKGPYSGWEATVDKDQWEYGVAQKKRMGHMEEISAERQWIKEGRRQEWNAQGKKEVGGDGGKQQEKHQEEEIDHVLRKARGYKRMDLGTILERPETVIMYRTLISQIINEEREQREEGQEEAEEEGTDEEDTDEEVTRMENRWGGMREMEIRQMQIEVEKDDATSGVRTDTPRIVIKNRQERRCRLKRQETNEQGPELDTYGMGDDPELGEDESNGEDGEGEGTGGEGNEGMEPFWLGEREGERMKKDE